MKIEGAAQQAEGLADAPRRAGRVSPVLRALRVHQWIKNLLVFVPVLMAHRVTDAPALAAAASAFLACCLCASSVYLVNDLLDLEAHRQHPYKRRRPLASGALGQRTAAALVPALLVPGLALAFLLLPTLFGLALLLYLLMTTAYSLFLKRLVVV